MLPALRCQNARSFDHLFSEIFNTPTYFQHFFLPCASTLFQHLFSRAFLPYSSVECVNFHHRAPPSGARIPIVFQHGACPQLCRIPALPACISTVWNRLLCARSYSILSCLPRKSAKCLQCSILFRMHFYCVTALSAFISIVLQYFLHVFL